LGRQLTRFVPYALATRDGQERTWLNVNLKGNYDTYDTSENNMRKVSKKDNKDIDTYDMLISKASLVSQNPPLNNWSSSDQERLKLAEAKEKSNG